MDSDCRRKCGVEKELKLAAELGNVLLHENQELKLTIQEINLVNKEIKIRNDEMMMKNDEITDEFLSKLEVKIFNIYA